MSEEITDRHPRILGWGSHRTKFKVDVVEQSLLVEVLDIRRFDAPRVDEVSSLICRANSETSDRTAARDVAPATDPASGGRGRRISASEPDEASSERLGVVHDVEVVSEVLDHRPAE